MNVVMSSSSALRIVGNWICDDSLTGLNDRMRGIKAKSSNLLGVPSLLLKSRDEEEDEAKPKTKLTSEDLKAKKEQT